MTVRHLMVLTLGAVAWLAAATLSAQAAEGTRRDGAASSVDDRPVPPKDAQYTVYCRAFSGPDRIMEAKQAKQQMQKATGLKGWYLVHAEKASTLYFGYYRTISSTDPKSRDGKEAARAKGDLQKIRGLIDSMGDRLFPNSLLVEIETPDPDGPPEWNLTNAPADAFWSLEIGAYQGSPDRKRFAVEAVKEARQAGYEAYYYHGSTVSSVCIGLWPREAVQESEPAAAPDPSTHILVLPQPLPDGAPTEFRDKNGRPVKAVVPRADPQDPKLIEMMRKFPAHLINGMEIKRKYVDPQTGQTQDAIEPSLLVMVPRGEADGTPGGDAAAQRQATEVPAMVDPGNSADVPPALVAPRSAPERSRQATTPGAGRLKSIGD